MQTTNTVLMIRPVAFGYNAETAKNNYFQSADAEDPQPKALAEFDAMTSMLKSNGINVIVVEDTLQPHTPDSIFPNNWVSFGADGTVVLYPMFADNRRVERRQEVLDAVRDQGFVINNIDDWSSYENEGRFLEGTGSMIFDHDNKIAYGSKSLRLDEGLFIDFCNKYDYQPVVFTSYQTVEGKRLPIYHTNVMMCVADHFVVICLDAIDDETERENVVATIKQSKKEIVDISEEQMHQFAGNMLQVHNEKGHKFLVMSQSAYRSLTKEQATQINRYCQILSSELNTIETNGGGSARCMLAEVFLPKK